MHSLNIADVLCIRVMEIPLSSKCTSNVISNTYYFTLIYDLEEGKEGKTCIIIKYQDLHNILNTFVMGINIQATQRILKVKRKEIVPSIRAEINILYMNAVFICLQINIKVLGMEDLHEYEILHIDQSVAFSNSTIVSLYLSHSYNFKRTVYPRDLLLLVLVLIGGTLLSFSTSMCCVSSGYGSS